MPCWRRNASARCEKQQDFSTALSTRESIWHLWIASLLVGEPVLRTWRRELCCIRELFAFYFVHWRWSFPGSNWLISRISLVICVNKRAVPSNLDVVQFSVLLQCFAFALVWKEKVICKMKRRGFISFLLLFLHLKVAKRQWSHLCFSCKGAFFHLVTQSCFYSLLGRRGHSAV